MSDVTIYFADINDPDETGTEEPNFCDVVLASDVKSMESKLAAYQEHYPDLKQAYAELKAERDALDAENKRLREALICARYAVAVWQGEPREYSCMIHAAVIRVIDSALSGGKELDV